MLSCPVLYSVLGMEPELDGQWEWEFFGIALELEVGLEKNVRVRFVSIPMV